MVVVNSLIRTVDILYRNPIIIGLIIASWVFSVSVSTLIPLVGGLIALAVAPFILGGTHGITQVALDGESPHVDEFISSGIDNYVSLSGAFALMTVVFFIIMAVIGIIVSIILVGVGYAGLSSGSIGIVAAGLIGVVAIAISFGLIMAIQFFDVAIVLGDADAVESFRESWEIVRTNIVSVTGYTLVRLSIVFSGIAILWAYLFFVVGISAVSGNGFLLGGSVLLFIPLAIIVQTTVSVLTRVYHVVYYHSLSEE